MFLDIGNKSFTIAARSPFDRTVDDEGNPRSTEQSLEQTGLHAIRKCKIRARTDGEVFVTSHNALTKTKVNDRS
jgi:hypothetical protein